MAVKKRAKTLAHGRPPVAKHAKQMNSKQTQNIISTHHRLEKEKAAAIKKGDQTAADALTEAIEKNGGLPTYQAASKLGQSKVRGGDSSKVLVEWLQEEGILKTKPLDESSNSPLRLLEVGALSTKNEISRHPKQMQVTRIDLNSQEPGIEQQDFMERPLPTAPEDRFDILSLSLVLNYVPDPVGRGEMLKRLAQFLQKPDHYDEKETKLPSLFFVLPLPCVKNSRYMNEKLLLRIMENLGFAVLHKKSSTKLCYYLFRLARKGNKAKTEKRIVNDGVTRNNFSIIVK
ncbi:hypothetical protein P154DRAFT_240642 [Amniculicola lignicola CBS 123094]|uniref:25S rRNA adenine-N(1) methyltransferase n=1 Tax=Amniculicola lignicola CBS 123094 TaxID=1392246 RepID=A0A6A5WML6_9PLEO|nr:hypothetical protein P154DRAFT_240642 [Amniculicola lignicola CBS 123094]